MKNPKPRLRLDDDGAKRAAQLIAHAAPSLVPEVIERRQTDPRVRNELRQWLASRNGKAA